MFAGYIVVAVLAAAANIWAAMTDFTHAERALANAAKVGVPPSWLFPLGALKAAGALGLLVGMAVPVIGVAAAIGLVLFFVCAIFAHLRVSWYSTIPFPAAFLLLAVGALLLRLASM
jgi:DoxX-like family